MARTLAKSYGATYLTGRLVFLVNGSKYALSAHAEREGDVLEHRHVREEGVVLEDHADVALVRRHPRDRVPVDEDLAGVGEQEPGDEVEGRGLARTARAQECDEAPGRDGQAHLLDRGDRPEALGDVLQPERRPAPRSVRDGRLHAWLLGSVLDGRGNVGRQ